MKWWDRVRTYFIKLWVHFFVRVSLRTKCPACGARKKHEVKWSEDHGHLLHRCAVCTAVFGEQPVVKHQLWKVDLPPEVEHAPITLMAAEEAKHHEVRTERKRG